MSETDPLAPGLVIAGKYRVDRVLGRGGMAVVFAATHLQLRELVAIKVLHPHIRHRAGTVERFLREARVAMRLRSEHVARVFDIGTTEEGSPFIVMELLAGADFATLLREQGPFLLRDAVDYLLQACQALAEAHATGVVHRDLKPANVFLCASVDGAPSVKVLDFGVSKLLVEDATTEVLSETVPSSDSSATLDEARRAQVHESSSQSAPATLTLTRALLGSPLYMAPEQIRSARDVDARADVWALGVLLFELVSGARPFQGDSLDELCSRIAHHHPAPFHPPGGPLRELEAVLGVCLAKDPADRYQSVLALAEALVGFGTADARASLERIVRIAEPRTGALPSRLPRGTTDGTLSSARSSGGGGALAGRRTRSIVRGATAMALFAAAVVGAWGVRERMVRRGAAAVRSSAARCTSSRACTKDHGAPSRCRADGECVALASVDCEVHAGADAIDGDDTVWFGTMLPLKGPTFGQASLRSIDVARGDFEQMMSSFAHSSGAAHVPPFGVLACDDTKDAMRAARHLVENVRVPAIIGFESAATLIDVGGSLLVPNGVLAVASLTTSPLATSLPMVPGQPRLVWRTTYSSADSAKAIGRVVPDLLEPQVRALPGVLAGAPIRVALVRSRSRGGSTFDDMLLSALRFNGKSVVDNAGDFRALVVDESDPSKLDADVSAAAQAALAFAPHVTLVILAEGAAVRFLDEVERGWSRAAYRPRYLFMTNLVAPVLDWIGTSVDRRRRAFGVAPVASRSPNVAFALHYNEVFPEKTTPSLAPSESYDAFYLLAYATYALGDVPPTGASLARAIPRLMPPGKPIDVGPARIFDAYSALRRGESIDLNGAVGSLDFDPSTGEEPVDQTVVCAAIDEHGRAFDDVESGVVFSSAKNALEGALRCP
jgi:serine/threonine protein kinase